MATREDGVTSGGDGGAESEEDSVFVFDITSDSLGAVP